MRYLPLFLMVFLVGFAGLALADANLDVIESSVSVSGNHNSAASTTFTLNNTNTSSSITNLSCSLSYNNWNITCNPTTLASNATQTVSLAVTIPQYATVRTGDTGTLTVMGNLTSTAAAVSDTVTVAITVLPSASYSLAWTAAPTDVFQERNQTVAFTITNTGNVALTTSADMSMGVLNSTSYSQAATSLASQANLTGSLVVATDEDTSMGNHTLTLNAFGYYASNASVNSTASDSITFNVIYPYCEDILVANLTNSPINLVEIKNENDILDETFEPLEEIEIEVKVENKDDDDRVRATVDVVVIYNDGEVDDTDEDEKKKIKDDDTETITLTIKLPADIKEGQHYLYIRVTGESDTNCEQKIIPFEVDKEKREVVPVDVEFDSEVACGSSLSFSGKAVNVGQEEEEKVRVVLKTLGLIFDDVFDDLDEGDDSPLFDWNIAVPSNVTGTEKMSLTIYYEYDGEDETYEEDTTFSYSTKIVCDIQEISFKTEASIAELSEESNVRVLVKNPSASSQTYNLAATADWATVDSIEPSSLTLSPGSEQYVTVKLTPNSDAEGAKSLQFKATYNGKTEVVNVPVTVEKASKMPKVFSNIADSYKNNTAWAVINTVLVLAIIAVVALIFTGKNKPDLSGALTKLKKAHK